MASIVRPANLKTPLESINSHKSESLPAGYLIKDNYKIVKSIGRGGMAHVYLARQLSLDRDVAIKVLSPRFSSSRQFIDRFKAESKVMSLLSHPNIVTVLDCGTQDGIYYIVMEFVRGCTLDNLILQNKLKDRDWTRIIRSCSDALSHIHGRRLVHLDMKASNILIGEDGQVYLADFGVSRLAGRVVDTADANSSSGTASYMSPEQRRGSSRLDQRSDVFSLGVTIHKMLTREYPSCMSAAPSSINRRLPVGVNEVIWKALGERREDRFQTVKDFCDSLLIALQTDPVSSAQTPPDRRTDSTTASKISLLDGITKSTPRRPAPKPVAGRKFGTKAMIGGSMALLSILLLVGLIVVLLDGDSATVTPRTTSVVETKPLRSIEPPAPVRPQDSTPLLDEAPGESKPVETHSDIAEPLVQQETFDPEVFLGRPDSPIVALPASPSLTTGFNRSDHWAYLALRISPGKYDYNFYTESGEWTHDVHNPESRTVRESRTSILNVPGGSRDERGERAPWPKVNDSTGEVIFRFQNTSDGKAYVRGDFNNWEMHEVWSLK